MEPAPSWGGEVPEKNYKEYHRNLQLWLVEAEARLPHNLIGKRIIDGIPLGSKLSALLAHLTVDEICAENGHKRIVAIIEDHHEYLKDQRLEQAFDDAIFKGRRERGQTMTSFLTAKKAAFAELKKQGLDLLASAPGRHLLGHLLLRQGSFTQDQRQRLKVVTNGSIDFKNIEKAIHTVFGDRLEDSGTFDNPGRRWRRASYYGDDGEEDPYYDPEYDDGTYGDYSDFPEDIFEYDIFDDLVALAEDTGEAKMVFYDDLPMVMDESEAVEIVGNQIAEIYYQSRERLASKGKGKGKGKKGKGKGHSKTFAQPASNGGFGAHGKGGYLEHRRLLQANRTGRGFERPWQQRQGTRQSLAELKARSRCHQCKQVGHWSRECPQRQRGQRPSTPGLGTGPMSTGFFVQPPKEMTSVAASFGGGQQFLTQVDRDPAFSGQYMQSPSFAALSFCFMNHQKNMGTALVDTAAQHGLVGKQTLEEHDHFLKEQFGLQVQWSCESGGSVRGVCGAEETTSIAYVPIGLGGRSGVLRVQVVPGDIPFLLPAYFLTELEAVIDMKHAMIMYMKLGVKQYMTRMASGHVAVSIVEFGHGFHIPSNLAAQRSQAWCTETVPTWSEVSPSHAHLNSTAMAPVAALVAAALYLGFPSRLADHDGSGQNSSTTICATIAAAPRTSGTRSTCTTSTGAESSGAGSCNKYCSEFATSGLQAGRSCATIGYDPGQGQVPGTGFGTFAGLHSRESDPWSQSVDQLPTVPGLQTRAEDATDLGEGPQPLEQQLGVPARGLHQEADQQGAGQARQFVQSCREINSSEDSTKSTIQGEVRGGSEVRDCGAGYLLPHGCSVHRGAGHLDARDDGQQPTPTTMQSLPCGFGDTSSASVEQPAAVEVRQPQMRPFLCGDGPPDGSSTGNLSLSGVQCGRDGAHPDWRDSGRDGGAVRGPGLRLFDAPVRDAPGVPEDGSVQRRSVAVNGCWLGGLDAHYELDETFYNSANTYVVLGHGDHVVGVAPCVTKPIVERRLILAQHGKQPWCALDVSTTPGGNYELGCRMHYLILYEFSPDFAEYMVDAEFENEVYGSLVDTEDAIVEIYSPPRVVAAATMRGLRASLSVDLDTGYDLSQPHVRQDVRRQLQQRRPRLLVTSPPCTKFSPMQNIRAYPERLAEELGPAIEHMNFSMILQEDQLDRGDHGLHEHPDLATSWGLPKVKQYLSHDEVLLVKSHQCRFGLRIRGRLSRKSTLFTTTCDAIATNLQKLCQCEEPHQRLESGLPQQAQVYPPELIKAIIDGLIQDWIDEQTGKPKQMPDLGDLEQWVDELGPAQQQQWRSFHGCAVLVMRRPTSLRPQGPGHRSLRWTWVRNNIDNKWMLLEGGRTGKPRKLEVQYEHVAFNE
eukprot:Skav220594  [mRNA]  locus=scaffold2744:89020:94746:+ [translate_table: standard]